MSAIMENGETSAPVSNGTSSTAKPPPSLTKKQGELIVKTWAMVKEIGLEKAGIILFQKLFEIAPDLLELFPFDEEDVDSGASSEPLKKHGTQVMESIDAAVGLLGDPKQLVETLIELGVVHNMSNVQVGSFAPVGQALVYTLSVGLKDEFTEEVQGAWITLYSVVQHYMTLGMTEGLDCQA